MSHNGKINRSVGRPLQTTAAPNEYIWSQLSFAACFRCDSVSHGREFGASRGGPGLSGLVIPLGLVAPCQCGSLTGPGRVDVLDPEVEVGAFGGPAGMARAPAI